MAGAVILLGIRYGFRICYLTIWCAAAASVVLMVPGSLDDRGAQLSFAAVLALIFLAEKHRGAAGFLLTPLRAGLVVTLALAPLVSQTYGGFSPQAPVATLLSLPFMLLTMILGVAVLLPVVYSSASIILEWCVWIWTGFLGLMRLPLVDPQGPAWTAAWIGAVTILAVYRWRRGFLRRFR
jgi:predicted membrane metal-binding protein